MFVALWQIRSDNRNLILMSVVEAGMLDFVYECILLQNY